MGEDRPAFVALSTVATLDEVAHLVPYGPDGAMESGHLLTQDCPCEPTVDCSPVDPDVDVGYRLTVTHRLRRVTR